VKGSAALYRNDRPESNFPEHLPVTQLYLDHAATTPLLPRAAEALREGLRWKRPARG